MPSNPKVLISSNSRQGLFSQCAALFAPYRFDAFFAPKQGNCVYDKICEIRPDIVIMDVFMPDMDAIGVMQAVKKNLSLPTPLFMVLSSFDNLTLQQQLTQCGASYFFLRPVETQALVERVVQYYGIASGAALNPVAASKAPAVPATPAIPRVSPQFPPEMESKATRIMHQIGVPAHMKGFQYLRDGVLLALQEPEIMNAVTKQLYPRIAKKHRTTSSRVERALRHAIEITCERGNPEMLQAYFHCAMRSGKCKPTNSEFIAIISDKMRFESCVGM